MGYMQYRRTYLNGRCVSHAGWIASIYNLTTPLERVIAQRTLCAALYFFPPCVHPSSILPPPPYSGEVQSISQTESITPSGLQHAVYCYKKNKVMLSSLQAQKTG